MDTTNAGTLIGHLEHGTDRDYATCHICTAQRAAARTTQVSQPTRRVNQPCRRCHTYCYGDCYAN